MCNCSSNMMKYILVFVFLVNFASLLPTDHHNHKPNSRQLRDSGPKNYKTEPLYVFEGGVLRDKNEELPQGDEAEDFRGKNPVHSTHLAYFPPSNKDSRSYASNRRGGVQQNPKQDGTVRFESKVETLNFEGTTKILTRTPNRRGPSRNEDYTSKDSIVFPDELPNRYNNFSPVISKKCSKTFCEDIDNYPEQHVETEIKARFGEFKDLLGSDELALVNITQRIDVNEELPLCQSQEKLVRPTVAKNKNDEWFFIANAKDIEQSVRVEECISDNQPCALSNSFPVGYEGHCKQKYIYRKLVAIDKQGKAVPDNFKMPSCCSCFYTKTADTIAKFGQNKPNQTRRP